LNSHPFSIYVRNRPIRVAYLVNPSSVPKGLLDALVDHSIQRWGGRYNPIIYTDGRVIDDLQWGFLYGFDPDVVLPFVELEHDLAERIKRHIAPLEIEPYREQDEGSVVYSVHTSLDGLSIYPSRKNLSPFVNLITLIGEPRLVVFDVDDTQDISVERFIRRNLGVYFKTVWIEHALKQLETVEFRITDVASLIEAIETLSGVGQTFVYPIQLSSLPNFWPEVTWDYQRDAFTVVVGDSVEDFVHGWNHPLTVARSRRGSINELWFPIELATNPSFLRLLGPGSASSRATIGTTPSTS